MTQEEIIESNKMISNFMERVYPKGFYHEPQKMKYHLSWDWLMPVVHKCLEICHEKMIYEWETSFSDKFFTCSIESMYKEVVEFIKWRNKS